MEAILATDINFGISKDGIIPWKSKKDMRFFFNKTKNNVVIKFKAPAMDETPAICKLKILKSTAPPEWAILPLKGGYIVQPVPTPDSTIVEVINNKIAGGNNQKLILFNLGKDCFVYR